MNLSEALEQARRERLGQVAPEQLEDASDSDGRRGQGQRCQKCGCIGFPELVDLVRGTVEMVCPACKHEWLADRSAIPTA